MSMTFGGSFKRSCKRVRSPDYLTLCGQRQDTVWKHGGSVEDHDHHVTCRDCLKIIGRKGFRPEDTLHLDEQLDGRESVVTKKEPNNTYFKKENKKAIALVDSLAKRPLELD